ncbi:MAG: carbohydrate kinase family protein [Pseudaminobacter sp.]
MTNAAISDGTVVFFGSHAVDHYLRCAYWPSEGQKINAQHVGRVYGGMIPNAASIFAGYGQPPLLIGPLEDNDDADPILEELAKAGIDTRRIRRSSEFRNSYAYNFLSDANANEKTLVIVDPGYALELTSAERAIFRGARYIYSTIAHLTRIADVEAVIAEARGNGAKLFIDVEAESFRSAEKDWWAFSAADFLSFNEESLEKFRGGKSADTAIAEVLAATDGEVIVTLGKEGCRVATPSGTIRVAGLDVAAVDPLGAGDTFNSTYLFGRLSGWSVERSARFANAAAARSTTMIGPRSGCASVATVEAFLKDTDHAAVPAT